MSCPILKNQVQRACALVKKFNEQKTFRDERDDFENGPHSGLEIVDNILYQLRALNKNGNAASALT